MPTYDYRCDACGHELELFHAMTADPVTKCPSCGEEKLRRLIGSGAGIIFKGSGFYETDYKRARGGKSGDGKSDGGDSKSDSKSSESKSDSSSSSDSKKSESKSESKPAKSSD